MPPAVEAMSLLLLSAFMYDRWCKRRARHLLGTEMRARHESEDGYSKSEILLSNRIQGLLAPDILQQLNTQLTVRFDQARLAAAQGTMVARRELDETEKAYRHEIEQAQEAVADAFRQWEKKRQEVLSSCQPIIDAHNAEVTRLQEAIEIAERDYRTVMDGAELAVKKANEDRAIALQNAQQGVEFAKNNIDTAIDGAKAELDRVNMHDVYGPAIQDVKNARAAVQSLQHQLDGLYAAIRENEAIPGFDFGRKAALAGLYIAVGSVEASKAIADGVLQAAEGFLHSVEHVSAPAAHLVLDIARQNGPAALGVAEGALSVYDIASKAALEQAERSLQDVKNGASFLVYQGAIQALEVWKQNNGPIVENAVQQINNLSRCLEFVAYHASMLALEGAKGAMTVGIEAAKAALEVAKIASDVGLSIVQWIIEHPGEIFFAVRMVTVLRSGSPMGIIAGLGGEAIRRAVTAQVEGTLFGEGFHLSCEYDPEAPESLVTVVFQRLWRDIEKAVTKDLKSY